MKWTWQKRVPDFERMTNVSKKTRAWLGEEFQIRPPEVVRREQSVDQTIKFLMRLEDGLEVESVLIPSDDNYTQCVSTQVGCPMACRFCSTGRMGFARNLTSGEIAGQVLTAENFLDPARDVHRVRNIVLMGMGEPLLNWKEVRKALTVLRHADALNFSRRKITLSTVGVKKNLFQPGLDGLAYLAVSLHAPEQRLRRSIMPAAAEYSLEELLADLERYPLAPRERITIEYIMLKGVNDSLKQAADLSRVLSRLKCKINLIRYNPGSDSGFAPSETDTILAFQEFLRNKGYTVMLRKSMGEDIHAACGQLKAGSGPATGLNAEDVTA